MFSSASRAPDILRLGKVVFFPLHCLCCTRILSILQGLAGFRCPLKGHVHSSRQTSVGRFYSPRLKDETGGAVPQGLHAVASEACLAASMSSQCSRCRAGWLHFSCVHSSPTDSSPGDEKSLKTNQNQTKTSCGSVDVLQQHQQIDPLQELLLLGIEGRLSSWTFGHLHHYGPHYAANEAQVRPLVGSGCPRSMPWAHLHAVSTASRETACPLPFH